MPARRFPSWLAAVPVVALAAGALLWRGSSSHRAPAPGASSPAASAASRGSAPGDPLSSLHLDDAAIDWSRPVPVTPPGGVREAGYVGSTPCRPCHKDVYDTYAKHSMARTGLRPLASLDRAWLDAIFDAGSEAPITHERSGFSYRPFRDNGRYFVEERLLAPDGTRLSSWVQPLDYALSAGSYGLAFYFRHGKRVYQIPIDYYAREKRWGLDPGASKGDFRFTRALDGACIVCHADFPARQAGTDDVFVGTIAAGVGCERCHGPGAEHLRTVSGEDIVDPAKLPPARQVDVCAQCHEDSFGIERADHHDFDFRPGQPLDSVLLEWVRDPVATDRFDLLSTPERMMRSACFRKSGGKMQCTTCHDPHRSSLDEPPSWWDSRCARCHTKSACTGDARERMARGDHCAQCHMRSGPPTGLPLVSVTDHWIQRRPPPLAAGDAPPPDKLVSWPQYAGEAAPAGGDVEALRAVAYERAGREDEALRGLGAFVDRKPRVPQLYEWLARRFDQAREPAQAARAHAEVLRFDPDARFALMGFARSTLAAGAPDATAQATRALDRLLAIDPDDGLALQTKAMMLARAGRDDDAAPLFARAADAMPSAGPSHVALAVLALRAGRRDEAIAQLEAARLVEPTDGWILEQLAGADDAAGRHDARDAIEHVRAELVAAGRTPTLTEATRWLPPQWR